MAETLADFAASGAKDGHLPFALEAEACRRFGVGFREVEAAALAVGIRPARYARNAATVDVAAQARLHRARVAVVGCGGLGGHVLEALARMGVGTIVAVDPDLFDETNLNRQILSTIASLGRPKAEVAAERIAAVNPAAIAIAHRARLGADNAADLLRGCDAVADCLDSVAARLVLAEACSRLGIPLSHGAIAGWFGQATTQLPGGKGPRELYGAAPAAGTAGSGAASGAGSGAERALGNPAVTPALVASVEAAEICKILIGGKAALEGKLLAIDLGSMEFAKFDL